MRILSRTSPAPSRSWIAVELTTTGIGNPFAVDQGVDSAALHLSAGFVTTCCRYCSRFRRFPRFDYLKPPPRGRRPGPSARATSYAAPAQMPPRRHHAGTCTIVGAAAQRFPTRRMTTGKATCSIRPFWPRATISSSLLIKPTSCRAVRTRLSRAFVSTTAPRSAFRHSISIAGVGGLGSAISCNSLAITGHSRRLR